MSESLSTKLMVGSIISKSFDLTFNELSQHKIKVPAGTTDEALALGMISTPKLVAVAVVSEGAEGVSFKIGAAGTDDVSCCPIGVISDKAGFSCDQILVSNAGSVEAEVVVVAAE